jgi:hypothetical protein
MNSIDFIGRQELFSVLGVREWTLGGALRRIALLGVLGLTGCGGDAGYTDDGELAGDELELGSLEQAWSSWSCGRDSVIRSDGPDLQHGTLGRDRPTPEPRVLRIAVGGVLWRSAG